MPRKLVLISAAVLAAAVIAPISQRVAQQAALVRGNAPLEWRYWGADAWSTRYSAADQIDASNFDSLQVAWRWEAGRYGEDEYYRTTPL
jgi:quinoprotein glucose dehydrogenase